MTTLEARPEQSPNGEPVVFRLTNVGNQRVVESLGRFKEFCMKGPRAAGCLFSLLEPFPVSEDNLGLIRSETVPETLWDQVGWAHTNPQGLTEEQKGSLSALQYFALESLANNPQTRRVGGEERDLSQKARRTAQETFESYGKYLAKTLDPDNPESVKALKTIAAFGKASPLVLETIALAACAANIKATPTINSETQTPIPTMIATEVLSSPVVSPPKVNTRTQNSTVSFPHQNVGNSEWCSSFYGLFDTDHPPSGKGPFQLYQVINKCAKPGELGYLYGWTTSLEEEPVADIAGYYHVPIFGSVDDEHVNIVGYIGDVYYLIETPKTHNNK